MLFRVGDDKAWLKDGPFSQTIPEAYWSCPADAKLKQLILYVYDEAEVLLKSYEVDFRFSIPAHPAYTEISRIIDAKILKIANEAMQRDPL